jgi:hypothetical protein
MDIDLRQQAVAGFAGPAAPEEPASAVLLTVS